MIEPFRSWAVQNDDDIDWESDYTPEFRRLRRELQRKIPRRLRKYDIEIHPGNIGFRYGEPCLLDFL